MANKTFDQLRNETSAFLKRIAGGDRCYTELRTHLQAVAQRRLIAPVGKVNLATKVGQTAIVEMAEAFVSSKTIIGSTIRERGWTDGMIAKFLGEPDAMAKNPHYKSAAPMKLYSLSRVEAIEATSEWQAANAKVIAQRENRVAGAAKAVETKTAKLIDWVENLNVTVPLIEIPRLVDGAILHYGWHHSGDHYGYYNHDHKKSASIKDDPSFLLRITHNYIRHELTDYHRQLDGIAGKVGNDEAYEKLKSRIMSAIYDTYPGLYDSIVAYQNDYDRLQAEHRNRQRQQEKERRDSWHTDPKALAIECKRRVGEAKKLMPQKNQHRKLQKIMNRRDSFVISLRKFMADHGVELGMIDITAHDFKRTLNQAIDRSTGQHHYHQIADLGIS